MGLARPNQKMKLAPYKATDRKKKVLESMPLTSPEFSTKFSTTGDDFSYIDFGPANPKRLDEGVEPQPMQVADDLFWSLGNEAVRFGENPKNAFNWNVTEQVEMIDTGVYTLFDTGASDIMISDLWWDDFLAKFQETTKTEIEVVDGIPTVSCATRVDLYFLMQGQWLQVRGDDLIREVKVTNSTKACQLKLRSIDAPFNIMGLPIFMDYYVTHNFGNETSSMSFTPFKGSSKY